MSRELNLLLQDSAEVLERELERYLPVSSLEGSGILNQAIRCALFPGGKRMRPLFTLLAAHVAGGRWRDALRVACAIEYLHTCSLILDDLPCMDNALRRRGEKPTYLVFGESTAVLAAVALLNRAWVLLCHQDLCSEGAARTRRLLQEASYCIGLDGMIGGQFLDLSTRKRPQGSLESLLKTTRMTRFSLSSGAIIADAPQPSVEALALFGQEIGAAYQLLDDVIDMEADALIGPTANRVLLFDQARHRLDRAMDQLGRFLAKDSAFLLLEFTKQVFRPVIGRATECLKSETTDIQDP